jgi:hypothetical protein
MTAFGAMLDTLFGDPNIALDAVYRVGGAGAGTTVRVTAVRPDEIVNFGETRIRTGVSRFQLRASQVAVPAENDTLEIAGTVYRVQGAPAIDAERLVWSLDCVKV